MVVHQSVVTVKYKEIMTNNVIKLKSSNDHSSYVCCSVFLDIFRIDNKWQAFETVESGGAGFFIAEDEQEDICLEKAIGR